MTTTAPKHSTKLALRYKQKPILALRCNLVHSIPNAGWCSSNAKGELLRNLTRVEGDRGHRSMGQVEQVLNQPSGSVGTLQASGAMDWTATAVQKHARYTVNTTVV